MALAYEQVTRHPFMDIHFQAHCFNVCYTAGDGLAQKSSRKISSDEPFFFFPFFAFWNESDEPFLYAQQPSSFHFHFLETLGCLLFIGSLSDKMIYRQSRTELQKMGE